MPASFTRADVEAIAALAHLELEPGEADLFARQLREILEYANRVQAIDTAGVEPTTAVPTGHDSDRPDTPASSLDRAEALANAPDPSADGGFFRVPRVL